MSNATTFAAGRRLTAAQLNLKPYAHLFQTVIQSVTDQVWTAITFTSEVVDTMGAHSTSVNTTRFTPTVAGYYRCRGLIAWDGNVTGDRAGQFRKNGNALDGANYGSAGSLKGAGFLFGSVMCDGTIFCNGTTDYIELYGIHNKGSALNTGYSANGAASYAIYEWVAP